MDQPQYLRALEKILVSKKTISPDMQLKDCGNLDSMAVLELQALADEQFGLVLEPQAITDCVTVADLCRLVKIEPAA